MCSLAFQWTDYRIVAKHRSCSIFSCNVELKFFMLRRTQFFMIHRVLLCGIVRRTLFFYWTLQWVYSIVLDTSSSILQRVSSILQLNSVSESAQFCGESAQLCSERAQLRQRVLSILRTYCVKSPFHQWVLSFCILREVPLFTLHSVQEGPLYPVLRVYTTLLTLDSALLWNFEILYCVVILLCTA